MTSPAIVSRSGRPAATSVPNASTSSVSVSGQDSASDFIIAALLARLKSDHIAAGPVRRTVISEPDSAREAVLKPSGRLDHLRRRCARQPGDDRGPTVARDGDPLLRREHPAHAVVAAKHPSHAGERGAHRPIADPGALAGHDHRQRIRPLPGEVRLDRAASVPGLRARNLPTGARQRPVGERRERPEAEHDDRPRRSRHAGGGRPPMRPRRPRSRRWGTAFRNPVAHASDRTIGARRRIGHLPDLLPPLSRWSSGHA